MNTEVVEKTSSAGESALGGVSRGRIVVRPAQGEADIEALWDVYQDFHRQSRYKGLLSDKEAWKRQLSNNFIKKPSRYGLFIAEQGGRVIGGLGCMTSSLMFTSHRSSSVLGIYVLSSMSDTLAGGRVVLRLMQSFRAWSRQRKAVEMQVHVTHGFGLEKNHRFFRKMGFELSGGNYCMKV